ncbi:TetR/AcrR family transcriptional regulator [Amycolatopsis sp. NPDC004747]
MSAGGSTRRRAPAPEERLVDGERTRAALLEAALQEFSEKGFAGARVRDIAERAGVSKDLIAYHFGGKEDLYRAVQRAWLHRRDGFAEPDLPLSESLARYLHDALSDPRPMRLLAWRGLAGAGQGTPDASTGTDHPDADGLRRRQEDGELHPELDPATLQLVLLGAVAAPVVFAEITHRLFGVHPGEPEFENRYRDGLQRILRALGGPEEQEDQR